MNLTAEQIDRAAADLREAERSRKQIGLLSGRHPDLDLDGAYRIQEAFIRKKTEAGRRIVGWKIGLTSRAMQSALGIETPDSGALFDDMRFESGSDLPGTRFIQPRVEAEIAFEMSSSLSGDRISLEDVSAATRQVAPVLEILDTRIVRKDPKTGKSRTVCDTISDNAANAAFVLGDRFHKIDDFDLRWVGAIVRRDGVVEETGLGAGVLDNPLESVLWLARRLARIGKCISAGDLVLSGSFIRPIEAPPGSSFRADFGSFGTVECRFMSD